MARICRNVGLYLWKNFLEKKRRPFLTICEIICPVILTFLMVILFLVIKVQTQGDLTFETQATKADPVPFGLLPSELAIKGYKFAMAPAGAELDAILARLDVLAPAANLTALFGVAAKVLPANVRTTPPFSALVTKFNSEADVEEYVRSTSYGDATHPPLYGAIIFHSFGSKVDYSIRLNQTLGQSTSAAQVSIFQRAANLNRIASYVTGAFPFTGNFFSRNGRDGSFVGVPGFMAIQLAVDRAVLNSVGPAGNVTAAQRTAYLSSMMFGLTGQAVPPSATAPAAVINKVTASLQYMPQDTLLTAFPTLSFTTNPFYSTAKQVFAFFFVLTYLLPISSLIRGLVVEKENKLREGMKMMGMTNASLNIAWFLSYAVVFAIIGLLVSLATFWNMFKHSNFFLLFCMYLCFGVSCVTYCFLISVFFSRAKTAAVVGMMIFFGGFFPWFAVTGPDYTTSQKLWGSLLSPTAYGLALDALCSMEDQGVGIQWNTLYTVLDNYSYAAALWMMLLDTAIYFLLGMYLNEVWPTEFGQAQPLWFFVLPSYWRGESSDHDIVTTPPTISGTSDRMERPSQANLDMENQGRCIKITNLYKQFKTPDGIKVAVDHLNLTMYEGEIFVLLGHNGAGKTTTLSMLSGLLSPTSGDAVMFGHSIRSDLAKLREMMGVCPQHNVLFDDLTVKEHLEYFAGLKGVPRDQIPAKVQAMIEEVGLKEKTNVQSKALSGGMKRKLSVGIAMMGDSKVVFLDEPTSGMDPFSRRSTWNIIQNNRRGRVIILTTHFMDEADLLGDRIGIMADGTIRCCGSSMFLKSRYGVGYNLTAVKQPGCNAGLVSELVSRHVPGAVSLSNVGAEVSFQLPLNAAPRFGAFFRELDSRMQELQLQTYGMSVTTLEEVFLKVAELGDEAARSVMRQNSRSALPDEADLEIEEFKEEVAGPKTPVPAGATVTMPEDAEPEMMDESVAHQSLFWTHFVAMIQKRARYSMRDSKALAFQLVIPIVAAIIGIWLLQSGSPTDQPSLQLSTSAFNLQNDGSHLTNYLPYATNLGSNAMLSHVPTSTGTMVAVDNVLSYVGSVSSLSPFEGVPSATDGKSLLRGMSEYLLRTIPTLRASRYGAYTVRADLAHNLASVYYLTNTTSLHGAPLFLNVANDALYKAMHDDTYSITVRNHPLPFTSVQRSLVASIGAIFAALIIVFAYAFIPAAFIVFVVREREVAAKHQQLISGVSIPAYWLSTWVWDVVVYFIPGGAAIAIIYGFGVKEFTDGDAIGATVMLFLFYGTCSASFVYALSYMFKSPSNGQNFVLLANVVSVVLILVSFIMAFISSTADVDTNLRYVYRFLPGYALGEGLQALALKAVFHPKSSPLDMEVTGRSIVYLACLTAGYMLVAILIDVLLSYPAIRAKILRDPTVVDAAYDVDDDVRAEAQRIRSGAGVNEDTIRLNGIRKVYRDKKVAVRNLAFGVRRGECFGFLGINGAGKTTTLKILSGEEIPTVGSATLNQFDILREQPKVRRLLGYCPQFDALFELLTVREHLELFAQIKGVKRDKINSVVAKKIQEMDLTAFENKLAGALSGGNKRKLSVAISMIGNPPLMFLDEPSTGMDPVARRFMWRVIARLARHASIVLTTHSMEECEALCSRVGIMVGGRLRCLGSIQHLKNKFGSGYYVEIKLKDARADRIQGVITRLQGPDRKMTREEAIAACTTLGDPTRAAMISPTGSGWAVHASLAREQTVVVSEFARWWASESDAAMLNDFFIRTFQGAQLVERHGDQYRFKLPKMLLSVGQLFEAVEAQTDRLNVSEYSISQTTLEQIFNFFAAQQDEEHNVVRGMDGVAAGHSVMGSPPPAGSSGVEMVPV